MEIEEDEDDDEEEDSAVEAPLVDDLVDNGIKESAAHTPGEPPQVLEATEAERLAEKFGPFNPKIDIRTETFDQVYTISDFKPLMHRYKQQYLP